MTTTFRRQVAFEPGYNYLHETGPNRRGQHGMAMRFALIGPHGATQFLMNTNWTPLGEVDRDPDREEINEPCHVDFHESRFGRLGLVFAPMGYDVGYHWRKPVWDGQEVFSNSCSFTGGPCYYDGSGLMAKTLLSDFISHGEAAVWRTLIERYRMCVEGEADVARKAMA